MSAPARPAPPPPKPGKVRAYRALYPYTAQQADELTFEEGDVLYISDGLDTAEGWWRGTCAGKAGLVPSNYLSGQAESIDHPLHDAAKRGNLAFLQECLQNSVSVNSLDKSASTALYWAAHSGHVDVVSALLACRGVSLDAQNKLGDTALHAAAWKSRPQVVEQLLQAGARHDLRNTAGKVPRDLANDPECGALLERAAQVAPNEDYVDEYAEESDED